MFGKQKEQIITTRIELSDEDKQALTMLDNDIQVLQELMSDLTAKASSILNALHGKIVAEVPVTDDGTGVEPFEGRGSKADKALPTHEPELTMAADDPNRIRTSPFTRAPRSAQVVWLKEVVLADGAWHSALSISRDYANDEGHMRYLRRAVSHRFREMHEDGLVDRRDSRVRGAMYEYRLAGVNVVELGKHSKKV